jgi:hypothetical protein
MPLSGEYDREKSLRRSANAQQPPDTFAASAEASSIFRRRATSCSMTGCKVPPSTDERATSATIRRARSSLYCMAANAALGSSVPDVETALISGIRGLAGAEVDRSAAGCFRLKLTEGPARSHDDERLDPRQSPKRRPPSPEHAKMTPLSFDRERVSDFAVGTTHSPGGHDEQWNHGQDQGRYQ